MTSFALITEGITDQVVIEAVLANFYASETEFEVNLLQPIRDQTDLSRQGDFAGWEKVAEYCSLDDFIESFSVNDFLIIQIDTDICTHPSVDIPLTDASGRRSESDIALDMRNYLISKMQEGVYEQFADKIIFAVCVDSIECWLLPLNSEKKVDHRRVQNCEDHLIRILSKRGVSFEKSYRGFLQVAKCLDKRKALAIASAANYSLQLFLAGLPELDD